MKITCFSDTHTYHNNVKLLAGDIAIFSGDCMSSGYNEKELIDFLYWYNNQEFKYKIMVAGNHDRYIQNFSKSFKELLSYYPSIIYLEDSAVEIEGIKIYGTPHQKYFYKWAFNNSEEKLKELFNLIPEDVEILVSHAPSYGVLDWLQSGQRVGEETLKNRIEKLNNLKFHIFGHIHEAYGIAHVGVSPSLLYTAINCSIVDEEYRVKNKPITFYYGREEAIKGREGVYQTGEETGTDQPEKS